MEWHCNIHNIILGDITFKSECVQAAQAVAAGADAPVPHGNLAAEADVEEADIALEEADAAVVVVVAVAVVV